MILGGWNVKVNTEGMPQEVATAFGALCEMVGAEYKFIAYLGDQMANGINHALLCEQTLITGRDVKNIVLVTFRQTKEGTALSSIERVVSGGDVLGGVDVDAKVKIPDVAMEAFNKAFEGFVGSDVKPFALLATQITSGIKFIFAAESATVSETPVPKIVVVSVDGKAVDFTDVI